MTADAWSGASGEVTDELAEAGMIVRDRRGIPRDAVPPGRPDPGNGGVHGSCGEIAAERSTQEAEVAPQPRHLLEQAPAGHGLSGIGSSQAANTEARAGERVPRARDGAVHESGKD